MVREGLCLDITCPVLRDLSSAHDDRVDDEGGEGGRGRELTEGRESGERTPETSKVETERSRVDRF